MGGKASIPAAPDYTKAAEATAAGNLENARYATEANRVNTYTPYGNLTYTNGANFDQAGYDAAMKAYQDGLVIDLPAWLGGAGGVQGTAPTKDQFTTDQNKWTAKVELSPAQQALLDKQNESSLGLAGLQSAGVNRVANAMDSPYASAYDPTKATNSATEQIMSRLAPQFQREDNSLENKLVNQGLMRGSEAFTNAMADQSKNHNDAYVQAALQGINLGQNQQNQTYNQQMALRNAPMNELNALRTGSQVTNPSFQNAPQQQMVGGPNYMGAATSQYQSALDAANAQNASGNNFMNGLFSLGGNAMTYFSDRRLKKDIKLLGKAPNGLNVYSYKYTFGGGEQVGYMADEVQKIAPHAVGERDGFLTVDYSKV